ncbi:MAG: tRNA uridine-5-carboxymethylaminomethyl(34) synthesis GTPase MnmE [Bacteroidia bacterium]|nr:tRNA uridine-5-carboxymethylaminomethyl(34) synthesis GTPase MnmE [Bacteroidia bacterium]
MSYTRNNITDPICAIATAAGIGAIGVIRVSGKDAITLVNKCFTGKNLEKVPSHTLHLGKFMDGDKIVDEVLASVFIEPKSYTGQNTIELSCHGSPYIQQRILQVLVQQGARLAQPGEFTLRAFLNKKLDLTQAEAVADLIASDSEVSHKTAMLQMRGGFSLQIATLKEKLVNFASLIELELDFSEEDVEFASRPELRELVQHIYNLISELINSFKYGNAIKNGIPTVIAGKPNAGKSTLLNALVNEERAIVSAIAGTTRDTIEEMFVINGIMFRLIDTAGIREHAADSIESIGIERAHEKIKKASIILYLFDALTTTPNDLSNELMLFDGLESIIIPIGNKIDLGDEMQIKKDFKDFKEVIFISSKEKVNISQLTQRLIKIIENDKVNNDIIITNIRHYEALKLSGEALESVLQSMKEQRSGELLAFDIRKAIFHLGEIVGDISTDDLLTNIFSKFCIGK